MILCAKSLALLSDVRFPSFSFSTLGDAPLILSFCFAKSLVFQSYPSSPPGDTVLDPKLNESALRQLIHDTPPGSPDENFKFIEVI